MRRYQMTEEIREKMRNAKLLRPTRYWKGKKLSLEHRKKLSESHAGQLPWCTGKKRPELSGELHPNWKGGITPEKKRIRMGKGHKLWRRAVLERDNHTCVICGSKENLHVDHIRGFAYHPELRFEISNGRTLCKPCHLSVPTSKSSKHVCCP